MNQTTSQLTCKIQSCAKTFAVIPQEMKFYQDKKLPIPDHCPACRHKQRMALRTERTMYRRACENCQQTMLSVYPEKSPYKIFCQKCFWDNIG